MSQQEVRSPMGEVVRSPGRRGRGDRSRSRRDHLHAGLDRRARLLHPSRPGPPVPGRPGRPGSRLVEILGAGPVVRLCGAVGSRRRTSRKPSRRPKRRSRRSRPTALPRARLDAIRKPRQQLIRKLATTRAVGPRRSGRLVFQDCNPRCSTRCSASATPPPRRPQGDERRAAPDARAARPGRRRRPRDDQPGADRDASQEPGAHRPQPADLQPRSAARSSRRTVQSQRGSKPAGRLRPAR